MQAISAAVGLSASSAAVMAVASAMDEAREVRLVTGQSDSSTATAKAKFAAEQVESVRSQWTLNSEVTLVV